MNLSQALDTLADVHFPGYRLKVHGDFQPGDATYLQATFMAIDTDRPGARFEQKTRKWLLSAHMTVGELVQTAFKCVMTAVEHETREQFRYQGEAIFGPHFDLAALVDVCRARRLQFRQEQPA